MDCVQDGIVSSLNNLNQHIIYIKQPHQKNNFFKNYNHAFYPKHKHTLHSIV